MNNSYITIIKEKRTALSRKRVPLNQNECTDDFRIGVPFEQNLHNEEAVIQAVTDAGFDSYEKKLLGITAMQKRLGKSRFDELLTAYIEKPQGKPTLVPESDKRPAMNNAKTDFMEEN